MLFELLGHSGLQLKINRTAHLVLRKAKYGVLLLFAVLLAAGCNEITVLEPFGLFASIYAADAIAISFASVFVLSAVIGGRIWCMYLCPLGALQALFSRLTLT